MNTEQLIDVTDILAQPREFAQRLARVERERAELIETVARLRAELNGRQVVGTLPAMTEKEAEAYKWASNQSYASVAARLAKVLSKYIDRCASLRQPALARQISTSDGVTWHTFGGNTPPEQVVKPAPAGGEARP